MIADTVIDEDGRFVGKLDDLPLIVRAVNSHAALVEALRECDRVFGEKEKVSPSQWAAIVQARAALAESNA